MWDEPLEGDVDVVLLLAGDGVAADLPILDGVQVHLLDQAVLVQSIGKISFVAQHQDRNSDQLRLLEQVVQLVAGRFNLVLKVFKNNFILMLNSKAQIFAQNLILFNKRFSFRISNMQADLIRQWK